MEIRPLPLSPFPGERAAAGLSVSVGIAREGETLRVRHSLAGDLAGLAIPPPARRPERRDRLWQLSCMELFLAERGAGGYLEFNLSPAGHWNVWRFDSYRQGMREEAAFVELPFLVTREQGVLSLSLSIGLEGLFPAGRPLVAAAAAVVLDAAGDATHWALAHPASRPDFHARAAFLLDLPAS
jgi:hypothetical protein